MIDLHCHSTASDGTDSPTELVHAASAAGISVLAITDHDTTAGWDEAAAAVQGLDRFFTLVRGAEFSCVYLRPGEPPVSLHLLGYLFDPADGGLRAERLRLRENRVGRGRAIVENLVAAGYPIRWERVTQIAAGGSVGRPHIGQALMEAGVVTDVNEAFGELLSDDSPYYVAKADSEVLTMIGLIRGAGGVPVIAHPWARRRGRVLDEQALRELVDAGLAGIEVDHVDHSPQDRDQLRSLAGELHVFTTGSSDYHGTHKSVRLAAETTDPQCLQEIVTQASGVGPVYSPSR
ncbi:MAG TPA: PHP domain-containing protein [Jatrophihabitans sp.]|nr:PHP domain-containing protein [Jatrophihabitans sp.]